MTDQRRIEIVHACMLALVTNPGLYHETVAFMEQLTTLVDGRSPCVVIQALDSLLKAALEVVSERMDCGQAIDARAQVN